MRWLRLGLPLAIIAILIGALWLRFTPRTDSLAPAGSASTDPTARVIPGSPPVIPRASGPVTRTSRPASPAHTGSDADTTPDPAQHRGILAAAQAFLQAWTETDPGRRRTQLQVTATPRLAGPLLTIPTDHIPTSTPTGTSVTHASAFAAVVTTTNPALVITLVAAPGTTHGWLVDDIDR